MGNTPPAGSAAAFPPPDNLKTQWDIKLVYKLIIAKQLAPFFPYVEDEDATVHAEECPICLNFVVGGMNRSRCCNKGLCTACYITIKKTPATPLGCPFCLGPSLEVEYRGPKTLDQIQSELDDERKVKELRKKIRDEEIESDRLRELKREKEREEARRRAAEAKAAAEAEAAAREKAKQDRIALAMQTEDPELAEALLASLTINMPSSDSDTQPSHPLAITKTPTNTTPPPPTPPNSPDMPLPPRKDDVFPPHLLRVLNDSNATDEERDAAQLEAAVWLSLHAEASK